MVRMGFPNLSACLFKIHIWFNILCTTWYNRVWRYVYCRWFAFGFLVFRCLLFRLKVLCLMSLTDWLRQFVSDAMLNHADNKSFSLKRKQKVNVFVFTYIPFVLGHIYIHICIYSMYIFIRLNTYLHIYMYAYLTHITFFGVVEYIYRCKSIINMYVRLCACIQIFFLTPNKKRRWRIFVHVNASILPLLSFFFGILSSGDCVWTTFSCTIGDMKLLFFFGFVICVHMTT